MSLIEELGADVAEATRLLQVWSAAAAETQRGLEEAARALDGYAVSLAAVPARAPALPDLELERPPQFPGAPADTSPPPPSVGPLDAVTPGELTTLLGTLAAGVAALAAASARMAADESTVRTALDEVSVDAGSSSHRVQDAWREAQAALDQVPPPADGLLTGLARLSAAAGVQPVQSIVADVQQHAETSLMASSQQGRARSDAHLEEVEARARETSRRLELAVDPLVQQGSKTTQRAREMADPGGLRRVAEVAAASLRTPVLLARVEDAAGRLKRGLT